MIGRLNHVAIAVPDLERAAAVYRDTLGAKVSEPVPLAEHGVTTVFVELPNTKLELIDPARGRARRSPGSSPATRTAARTTCVTRWMTSAPRATVSWRRAPAFSGTASRGPARTASRCSSSIPKDFCGTLVEIEQA